MRRDRLGQTHRWRRQKTFSCPSAIRGLTLVEVLIAVTVLAVVLLPVMVGFAQALITTSQTTISSVASSAARDTIENLKALGYDNVLPGQSQASADLRQGDGFFRITTTVTEAVPNDASKKGLKLIEVAVSQKGSQTPMVVLTTYFTPVGV